MIVGEGTFTILSAGPPIDHSAKQWMHHLGRKASVPSLWPWWWPASKHNSRPRQPHDVENRSADASKAWCGQFGFGGWSCG